MANELAENIPVIEAFAQVLPIRYDSEDLAQTVLRKVQDASYNYDDVLALFNKCLLQLSGRFLLPNLEVMRDILTDPGRPSIPVPADYQKNIRYAHSISHNRKLTVYGSVILMNRWFSVLDQAGVVIGLAVKGRDLYYQRVPSSAETIRINYWAYPEPMHTRYAKPTCLPVHLIEPLLVNYACKELYSEIEDGIDGQKVNTAYHGNEYNQALTDLNSFLGPEGREPQHFGQDLNWNAWLYG